MLAVGLMSGTSRDGIDAAMIRTDGEGRVEPVAFLSDGYSSDFREKLAAACARALTLEAPHSDTLIDAVADELTELHADITLRLVEHAGAGAPDIIGFHGHTVAHRPDRGWTWQIGDGTALARACAVPVVSDLRSADVAAGGQGAPLLPVYHRARAMGLERPVAILNLGGVANISWMGKGGELIAFDTGMASGLIDSWMLRHEAGMFDKDGATAAQGQVDERIVSAMLDNNWFRLPAPKSIDRDDFTLASVAGLSLSDGAATLTAFTARSVALALDLLPARPRAIYVAGGGRHNPTLMAALARACDVAIHSADALGWNGDALEAEGFAYMAVRSLKGLPISFPGTTGAPTPMTGGTYHPA